MFNSSPLGAFVFYIKEKIMDNPLRNLCFRPRLGILFFIYEVQHEVYEHFTFLFSSPLGDFVFYI